MSAYAYLQEKTTKTIENGNEQYTIKYTNSADPQDPDANKIQVDYAKKNTKITVNGSISQSGVINWEEDGTIGSSGGNSGNNSGENESGGGEGGSSTGSGNISSEELAKLKEGMEQLQGEVSNLKNQLGTTTNALETTKQDLQTTKDNLNSILTSQTRKDVLYESTEASQTGRNYNFTFPSGKSLGSYKMLIFYADAYSSATGTNYWCLNDSTMVEPKVYDKQFAYDITFSNIVNDKVQPKNWWDIYFSIPNENQFRIDEIYKGAYYSYVRIKKVIGIY